MNEATNWSDRVSAAAKIFNLTPEEFQTDLAATMGITIEMGTEALDDEDVFKFGDFREAYKSKPIAVLRMAFKALKGSKKGPQVLMEGGDLDERTAQLRALGLKVKLEDTDTATLLKLYLPDKPTDPVTMALKKRFATPVIAFHDDGTVAVTESAQYIADIEQGYPARESIMVDNKLTKLWPVGVKPSQMVDEDPLFPGQPLRNGYSIVNHRNWSKVSLERRQLCRIIVQRGDIDPNNQDAVLRLLERAEASTTSLVDAYPDADLDFREFQKKDMLPKLKVELGNLPKPNNPFGVRRQY